MFKNGDLVFTSFNAWLITNQRIAMLNPTEQGKLFNNQDFHLIDVNTPCIVVDKSPSYSYFRNDSHIYLVFIKEFRCGWIRNAELWRPN